MVLSYQQIPKRLRLTHDYHDCFQWGTYDLTFVVDSKRPDLLCVALLRLLCVCVGLDVCVCAYFQAISL